MTKLCPYLLLPSLELRGAPPRHRWRASGGPTRCPPSWRPPCRSGCPPALETSNTVRTHKRETKGKQRAIKSFPGNILFNTEVLPKLLVLSFSLLRTQPAQVRPPSSGLTKTTGLYSIWGKIPLLHTFRLKFSGWLRQAFEALPKYIFYSLLIPESETSISSYLAALYAGNMLLIFGFTPAANIVEVQVNSTNSTNGIWFSPTVSPPLNTLTSTSGYFSIKLWKTSHNYSFFTRFRLIYFQTCFIWRSRYHVSIGCKYFSRDWNVHLVSEMILNPGVMSDWQPLL